MKKKFLGSEHVSSQIWCYLKLVRWRVRWRDEKKIFWFEHVSSQIWCYLKLVRWRVRWRDEENFFWVQTCIKPNLVLSEISEMNRWRKFFWVRTCIKPNLVLSEISEMKSEMKRWRKFFWVQTCIKPNLVLSEISEMNRWRDEENFFGSEHVSSQIWCYLKLVRWTDEEKFFLVRTCIKPNLVLSEISEMKSEMKRWRKFFGVWTCIKPNLVLSEISEMKRWRVRWRDEQMKKMFFGSENVWSQIWCYLKLVRWRVRWDEQMKKNFFWVWTCIKPNLVLSEISEMKSEMKRWTNKEIFFWSEHVSSQIWCYLKLVRWRDEEWDEEMKKIFWVRTCIKSNLVLSEISEMKRWRVRWRDEKKNFGVRTCIKPNLYRKSYIQANRHTYIRTP